LKKLIFTLLFILSLSHSSWGQTDIDAIMMAKNNLCAGPVGSYGSWKKYWEGTLLRTNENLGTVSSTAISVMGNFGVTDDLNILVMAPWIKNQASAGTLHSMQGIQDLSLFGKYRFFYKNLNSWHLTGIGVLGVSTPLTNYVADYLPLSLGMHSTNLSGRAMFDLEKNNFYVTLSYAHILRSDITLDRNSYFTTELIHSNRVDMPALGNTNFRAGYRKGELVLECVADYSNTYKGFDMRRNEMPFPSNNMDALRTGVNVKIPIPKTNGLSVTASSLLTLAGRNMGKSFINGLGFFYLMDLSKPAKEAAK
jgi:hypothetical protein